MYYLAGSDDSSDESGDDTELKKEKRKKHLSESERAMLRVNYLCFQTARIKDNFDNFRRLRLKKNVGQ